MKQLIIGFLALSVITLIACNGGNPGQQQDMSTMNKDTTKMESTNEEKNVKEVTPAFAGIDVEAAGYIRNIIDHYLHTKNALANDNAAEASTGAKMVTEALTKVDKSYFSSEQKMIYDQNEAGLKEHAENISKTSDIKDQRSHFSMLSKNVYNVITAFGGGRTLYHDHCPMANDNKGAMWISEVADIKNPYMGKKMPTCGSVEEKIK
jgi:hypothetical protein